MGVGGITQDPKSFIGKNGFSVVLQSEDMKLLPEVSELDFS